MCQKHSSLIKIFQSIEAFHHTKEQSNFFITNSVPRFHLLLQELQSIITKLPLSECCASVLPEFGIRWKELSRVVQNSRLPMDMQSVARVLCQYAKTLPEDELVQILARLRLRLISTQNRTWHVIHLLEPTSEDVPFAVMMRTLPRRIQQALRGAKKNMRPEVEARMINDLLYISVQLVSDARTGSVLYLATPPGQPIALVTSLAGHMLRPCAQGLGYKKYEDAKLHGKDIPSLLRISDPAWNTNADHLATIPDYAPAPTLLPNGIDFTHKTYDLNYVDEILGPNPPLLTELTLKKDHNFHGKPLSFTMSLKSDNVAKTLKNWVEKGALAPTSELFKIFHEIKSNRIVSMDKESD